MEKKTFVAILHVKDQEMQAVLAEVDDIQKRLFALSQKIGRWTGVEISEQKDAAASGN